MTCNLHGFILNASLQTMTVQCLPYVQFCWPAMGCRWQRPVTASPVRCGTAFSCATACPCPCPACSAVSPWQSIDRTLPAWEEMELGHGMRGSLTSGTEWPADCESQQRERRGTDTTGVCIQVAQPWEICLGALKGRLKLSPFSLSGICGGWQSREVSEDWKERPCPVFSTVTVQIRLASLNKLDPRKILGQIIGGCICEHW